MVRNFDNFEVGHWYIYTGTERCSGWSTSGNMDFVLDHKPVKCDGTNESIAHARFEGELITWAWTNGFDNWIEIKDPKDFSAISPMSYLYSIKDNNLISIPTLSSAPFRSYYVLARPPFNHKDLKKESEVESIDGFKVGDKVKLRTEAEMTSILGYHKIQGGHLYNGNFSLTQEMQKFLGQEVTIKEFIHNTSAYNIRIEESEGMWHTDWLVPKLVGQQRLRQHPKNNRDMMDVKYFSGIPDVKCISVDTAKEYIKQLRPSYSYICDTVLSTTHISFGLHKKNRSRNYKGEF